MEMSDLVVRPFHICLCRFAQMDIHLFVLTDGVCNLVSWVDV